MRELLLVRLGLFVRHALTALRLGAREHELLRYARDNAEDLRRGIERGQQQQAISTEPYVISIRFFRRYSLSSPLHSCSFLISLFRPSATPLTPLPSLSIFLSSKRMLHSLARSFLVHSYAIKIGNESIDVLQRSRQPGAALLPSNGAMMSKFTGPGAPTTLDGLINTRTNAQANVFKQSNPHTVELDAFITKLQADKKLPTAPIVTDYDVTKVQNRKAHQENQLIDMQEVRGIQ